MSSDQDLAEVLPLSPIAFHVLVALAQAPRHGYGIAQEVEELTEGRIVMDVAVTDGPDTYRIGFHGRWSRRGDPTAPRILATDVTIRSPR